MIDIDKAFHAALNKVLSERGRGAPARLAENIGVTPTHITRLQKLKSYGSEATRRKIASALGYEYEDFLALGAATQNVGSKEPPPSPDPPEIKELLRKTREVLLSNNAVIASALTANIVAFHSSVKNEEKAEIARERAELTNQVLQARLEALEKKSGEVPTKRQDTGTEGKT